MQMTGQSYIYPSNYESGIIPLDTSFSNYVPNSLQQYTTPRMAVPTDFSMADSMFLPTSISPINTSQVRVSSNDPNIIEKKFISSAMLPGLKTTAEVANVGKQPSPKSNILPNMTTTSFSNRRSGNQTHQQQLSTHSHQQYPQTSMYSSTTNNTSVGEFSSSVIHGNHMMKDDCSPYSDPRHRLDDINNANSTNNTNTHDISFARVHSGAPIGKEDEERDKRDSFYPTTSTVNTMFLRQTTNMTLPQQQQQQHQHQHQQNHQQQQQSHHQALLPHPSLQNPPFLMYSAGYPPPPTPPPYVSHLDHSVLQKKNEGQPGLCSYRNVDQYQ
ncbi:hypothetical protein PHYBLDRAFT_172132 [Phycomyces blakesleeanus NRRL 1555(-)]|uniref:Uncharacterized protein n=1 Tax=Phycomyces blakesleeanus (strain ATCC 8743b / DSM 1359 / FGSC 10004 / NBRC 33097 / NRRL 1555) TaxID=763407 RepID=A0A162TSQ9_PHYB8|nr:hypothetical protein PHYBLDRAFT_172132 [Phycomyces blakesleeanus NRRL 1555(-)]OAD69493.1 hypothetical protein PHYBLDRAFT_172132 [Phycomyces blakesleeanus NRRL 1555(-)]|eukprot:XP_018287533.1 hypothetical protein PHYBLDRAFT_172132 [Phycomyces blakesleeanus NRRL 1555(-)]